MINLLLFLFPAGLSLKIKDKYFKEKMSLKDYILTYIKYVLLINVIILAVLYVYSSGTYTSLNYLLDNINFIFKYLLLSIIIAIIFPIFDEYLKKSVSIKLDFKVLGEQNVKKRK